MVIKKKKRKEGKKGGKMEKREGGVREGGVKGGRGREG